MKNFSRFTPRRIAGFVTLLIVSPFLSSCVVTEGYYSNSGSYYDDPGYSSYGYNRYNRPYYRGSRYYDRDHHDYDRHKYHDSSRYHRDRDHYHPKTTSSDKFRLVNYHEDKKKSHPKGYHSKEYWKSRGYSVKKNTFEKKDGKIVGSRKGLRDKHDH